MTKMHLGNVLLVFAVTTTSSEIAHRFVNAFSSPSFLFFWVCCTSLSGVGVKSSHHFFFYLPSVQSSSRTDLGHLQSWLFLPTSVLSIMDGAPMCHPQGSGGWPCPSHPILSLERLPTGMVQPVHLRQFWSPDSSRSSGGGLFASTIFSSSLSNIALHLSVHTNHSSASVPVCLCLSSIKVCPGVRLRHVPGLCTSCAGQTRDPWRAQGLGGTGSAPEAYSRTSWQMCLHTPASG